MKPNQQTNQQLLIESVEDFPVQFPKEGTFSSALFLQGELIRCGFGWFICPTAYQFHIGSFCITN